MEDYFSLSWANDALWDPILVYHFISLIVQNGGRFEFFGEVNIQDQILNSPFVPSGIKLKNTINQYLDYFCV